MLPFNILGREKIDPTGVRTRDSLDLVGARYRYATQPVLEESSTPTKIYLYDCSLMNHVYIEYLHVGLKSLLPAS